MVNHFDEIKAPDTVHTQFNCTISFAIQKEGIFKKKKKEGREKGERKRKSEWGRIGEKQGL